MKNLSPTITLLAAAVLGAFMLSGCSNPAEDVTPASVKAPTVVSETPDAGATAYAISADSTIDFIGSKVTGSHSGGFKTFTGALAVVEGQLVAAGSSVTIDMTSLWSDAEKLTAHLSSPDFFDVATFATSSFTFTGIEAGTDGNSAITGNLNLHGVSKSISFPAAVQVTDGAVSLKAEFFINRIDFGIKYPGKKDDLIREEVVIKLNVTAKA